MHPLNGYRDLNSYIKRLAVNANGNTITSFARELNPTGVGEYIYIYIYIYIYMCVCVGERERECVCVCMRAHARNREYISQQVNIVS